MPSFFDFVKRVAQGKPVFETADDSGAPAADQPPAASGPKRLPKVFIERTEYHMNGTRMDYYADILNQSDQEIELDKVRLLGIKRELDSRLRPGEKRQYLLYSGSVPQSPNDVRCELDYKDMSGDYFCGLHVVEYEGRTPSGYAVRRIRYEGIKDI